MVATDHARTAKSRGVLKPFFGVGVPEKMGSGALSLRARVVNLKEEAPPQAGEHARHWGAVGRVLDQRVPRRRGAGVPKGTRSGRRESRVHAAQAGCSIMGSSNSQFLSETKKLPRDDCRSPRQI